RRRGAAGGAKLCPAADSGWRRRQSAAATSTHVALPLATASTAASTADVPARRVEVTSSVRAVAGRSRTAAIVAAPCFSAYGDDVVAKSTPSGVPAGSSA